MCTHTQLFERMALAIIVCPKTLQLALLLLRKHTQSFFQESTKLTSAPYILFFLLLLHFALIYCCYISPVLCFDLATCLTVATKKALLLFNMHTHTRGEGKECAIQGTTIENHIHTHIKGGGGMLLLLRGHYSSLLLLGNKDLAIYNWPYNY